VVYPSYEELAEALLLDYTTDELLDSLKGQTLTPSQTEGVARLFGGWPFSQRRPGELGKVPKDLKASLLKHSLKSSDPDKIERAKGAFGSEPPN
jgi:hypothetical protein